jgi:hypothetical protein
MNEISQRVMSLLADFGFLGTDFSAPRFTGKKDTA